MDTPGASRSIAAAIARARERLLAAGIDPDEAALDARLLAQRALGWSAATLLARDDRPFPPAVVAAYETDIARRERREPYAYIVGEQEFWGLPLEVSPAVLIPRPETELLVEQTLNLFKGLSRRLRVLDLCTGSGAVAVALAAMNHSIDVVATDLSLAAIHVAHRNAVRHGVVARVHFVCADLAQPIRGRFDAIVANPPYVRTTDRAGLQSEVRDYEPGLALFAGDDGLDVIRRIVGDAPRLLAEQGRLLIEHGMGQDPSIGRLISSDGTLRMEASVRDLQDIPRVAVIAPEERRRA